MRVREGTVVAAQEDAPRESAPSATETLWRATALVEELSAATGT